MRARPTALKAADVPWKRCSRAKKWIARCVGLSPFELRRFPCDAGLLDKTDMRAAKPFQIICLCFNDSHFQFYPASKQYFTGVGMQSVEDLRPRRVSAVH